ncbi:hypothetical protein [Paenibacillus sp. SYP-B4298]|uniref:hypothetical protein n=1 Tax=Paenibacillus sp. SYP-B4298 TaxID=2996034 RepID=UPI0022DD5C9E|nr:hypothetical protein [Paenibacillus sp. SYP-B4298]
MPNIISIYPVHDFHLILELGSGEYRVIDLLLFVELLPEEREAGRFAEVWLDTEEHAVRLSGGRSIYGHQLCENSLPLQLPHCIRQM